MNVVGSCWNRYRGLCSVNPCCCGVWHLSNCSMYAWTQQHNSFANGECLRICHFGALWPWVGHSGDKKPELSKVEGNAKDVHISKCGSRPWRCRYCCIERQAWSNLMDATKSKWNFNWRTSARMWLLRGVVWWMPSSSKKSDRSMKFSSMMVNWCANCCTMMNCTKKDWSDRFGCSSMGGRGSGAKISDLKMNFNEMT